MLAENYSEIMRAAREKGVSVAFSATVGGGIPFLKNLALVSHADTVLEVGGIMNGTTNFILDEMQSKGADFAETLKKAQELGYAESNPSADIDAIDLRCKLALCCSVGFDAACYPGDIPTMGVRHIQKRDIDVFRAHGLRVRLIGKGVRLEDGSVCAFCEPTLVSPGQNEYSVYGVENYIYYIGERTGKHGFGGYGAGRKTTAVNVYLDAIDILHGFSPFDQISCKGVGAINGLFEEGAMKRGIPMVRVRQDLMDPTSISRRQMRGDVNVFMQNVMNEEPLDASLVDFDDDESW
jgi:homoserine dehydrogenase